MILMIPWESSPTVHYLSCHNCATDAENLPSSNWTRELVLSLLSLDGYWCSLTKAGDALSDAIPPTRPTRREAPFLSRWIRYLCCPSQGKFCFLSSFSLLFIERTYHWRRHSLFGLDFEDDRISIKIWD